jgi:propionate catabolism operon transcriptional regulator
LIERIASSVTASSTGQDLNLRALVPEIYAKSSSSTQTTGSTVALTQRKSEMEADLIRNLLEECNGDRDEVCRRLGIGRTTLWRKLKHQKA